MFAAANGRSTLGIPKAVGAEFIAKDAVNGMAAGTVFVAPDGDILLLKRAAGEENFGGHWALPGGNAEPGESPEECARREAHEEMGASVPPGRTRLIHSVATPRGKAFHTFTQAADTKFSPVLNSEHTEHGWFPLDALPEPIHPAVADMIRQRLQAADDMQPEEWDELRSNFAKWTREEQGENEHAEDALAFDRGTVRHKDVDGRLHIDISNISKAAINPYRGNEIPNWQGLGLDPARVYKLFRDPDELAKAAPTFNNIQLLRKHVPVNAQDHRPHDTVGSTGTDAEFEAPYLKNSLVIWDGDAINDVEDTRNPVRELSCSYRYRADMTPGSFMGQAYDGVMRDIAANHVALVKAGRAGSDVIVGDSALVLPPQRWNFGAFRVKPKFSFSRFAGAMDKKPAFGFARFRGAADSGFEESKHPRANNGQFGAGAGKSHAEHDEHHAAMAEHHEEKISSGGAEGMAHMEAASKHHDASWKHRTAQRLGGEYSAKAHEASEAAHKASQKTNTPPTAIVSTPGTKKESAFEDYEKKVRQHLGDRMSQSSADPHEIVDRRIAEVRAAHAKGTPAHETAKALHTSKAPVTKSDD